MTFNVPAEAYDRFMGRWSVLLATEFADFAGAQQGQRALDVGCGPGALTAVLAERLGPAWIAAVDPSESFVAAAKSRLPGVDVRLAAAETLPFEDATFDLSLAQLVVQFMDDPVAGVSELSRVTRGGGTVAACVWDNGGGRGPLSIYWRAAEASNTGANDEFNQLGTRSGQLAELFTGAGLADVRAGMLTVRRSFASFAEWWEPFTLGVGPAGAHFARLAAVDQARMQEACAQLLPQGEFELDAMAWAAAGTRPS